MQTNIDKFELNFINPINNKEKQRKISDNSLKKSNEIETDEIPKKMDLFESSQSCPFISNERKKSYDSLSVGVSQADTLSQTSESSFFLSYTTPNSQHISTNESVQIEIKDKDIPFYYGVEEYFKKIMPNKFIDYTQTKNYIHKNSFLQKNNFRETGIKIQKENINQGNIQVQNYFYFPFVYYPINNFFFNQYSNVYSNNAKNNAKNMIKKDTEIQKDKKENEDEVKNNTQKNEDNEQPQYGKKDEIVTGKNEQMYNSSKKESKNFNNSFNKNYNYKRNKDYNKKGNYYNKRYSNNNNNYQRQYNNKYSNYNNENDIYQDERTYYYNNNNYHKKKYQKPFENKFYGYK